MIGRGSYPIVQGGVECGDANEGQHSGEGELPLVVSDSRSVSGSALRPGAGIARWLSRSTVGSAAAPTEMAASQLARKPHSVLEFEEFGCHPILEL